MLQANDYTAEMFMELAEYAESISPSLRAKYALVHPLVKVPRGYLPIKIAQNTVHELMWDQRAQHWSIFVPTSPIPGMGNHYQLVGKPPRCYAESTFNHYNRAYNYGRGTHTIGYVAPRMLPILEAQLARVQGDDPWQGDWNSHTWTHQALQGVDYPGIFVMKLTYEQMETQMAIVYTAACAGVKE